MKENEHSDRATVDPDWVRAVRAINRLGIGPLMLASAPFQAGAGTPAAGLSLGSPVYSFDDVVWEVTQALLADFGESGLTEIIERSAAELGNAYGSDDYQFDTEDQFSTFMLFYLTTRDGERARVDTPTFFERFESWLADVEPVRLERLRQARAVGLGYQKDHLQALNDNTIDPSG